MNVTTSLALFCFVYNRLITGDFSFKKLVKIERMISFHSLKPEILDYKKDFFEEQGPGKAFK